MRPVHFLVLAALSAPHARTTTFECVFPADSSARASESIRFLLDAQRRKAYLATERGNLEIRYAVNAADTSVTFQEAIPGREAATTTVDAGWESVRVVGGVTRRGACRVR